jgi:hypothetical protein
MTGPPDAIIAVTLPPFFKRSISVKADRAGRNDGLLRDAED